MNRIVKYEYDLLRIGEEGFEKKHWDSFVKLNTLHDGKYFEVRHNGLRFNQFVGVLQVDGFAIEIHPKADRGDGDSEWQGVLLKMLKETGRVKLKSHEDAHLKRKQLNLLEVYFDQYLTEVQTLIRNGLVKKYRKKTGNVKALKGKLEFAGHLRNNLVHKERFFTTHQVYDTDHRIHHVLGEALKIVGQFSSTMWLNDKCRRVQLDFPEVKYNKLSRQMIDSIRLDRKTAPYVRALELARLIILNYSPNISSGSEKMISILFDMNELWEEYILKMLRKHVRTHHLPYTVKGQTVKSFWGSNSLKPDIEIYDKNRGKSFIVDTKWKRPGRKSASVEDLRQMYAYGRYWNSTRVLLLYPGEPRGNVFKEFENEHDSFKHQCKMGFASVLKSPGRLDDQIGEKILKQLDLPTEPIIKVLCGIIQNQEGQIFIARRRQGKSMAGKWEFPGGKLEEGESEQACLQRELLEELGMQVKVGEKLGENEHHYEDFSIRLIAYRCEFLSATYELADHDAYEWVPLEELSNYELAEADVPFITKLIP